MAAEKKKGKNAMWTQDVIKRLFELYEENVCLYDTKSPFYSNKHARADALCKIKIGLAELNENISIDDIKSKINNIRSQLSHELQKIKESRRSGAGTDEIYEPSIWWYDSAQFLLPYMNPKKGKDSLKEVAPEVEDSNHNERESLTIEEDSYGSSTPTPTPSTSNYTPVTKKVKRSSAEPVVLQAEIQKTLETLNRQLTEKSETFREQEFGNIVAKDLSEIDDIDVLLDVKHDINNIIYKHKKKWIENKRKIEIEVVDTLDIRTKYF